MDKLEAKKLLGGGTFCSPSWKGLTAIGLIGGILFLWRKRLLLFVPINNPIKEICSKGKHMYLILKCFSFIVYQVDREEYSNLSNLPLLIH